MAEVISLDELTATPHAVVFDTDRPRTVRLELPAGERLPEHRHPGTDIVFHVLCGALELTLDEEVYELSAGDVVRFSGDRDISPEAVQATTALIVLAPEAADA